MRRGTGGDHLRPAPDADGPRNPRHLLRHGEGEGDREGRGGGLPETVRGKEPFVRLLPPGLLPSTKDVRGSNFCDIAWRVDEKSRRVVVVSAIDNLVKGAAGAAVQCFNLMSGFPEEEGLRAMPLFP